MECPVCGETWGGVEDGDAGVATCDDCAAFSDQDDLDQIDEDRGG